MLLFSPYRRISEVPPSKVWEVTLSVLQQWGHIKSFRFDNGRPFGDPKRETISPLALRLIAYGSQVIFNPPRTPTRNAKVERCQGTTGRWSDPKNCPNIELFQQQLDYAVKAQRERFKTRVCKGKTRSEFYPALANNPNAFDQRDFQLHRVWDFLTLGKWYRKVSAVGQINLFAKKYQLGFQFKGKLITVTLGKQEDRMVWNCFDESQKLIKQIPADNINDGAYLQL